MSIDNIATVFIIAVLLSFSIGFALGAVAEHQTMVKILLEQEESK